MAMVVMSLPLLHKGETLFFLFLERNKKKGGNKEGDFARNHIEVVEVHRL